MVLISSLKSSSVQHDSFCRWWSHLFRFHNQTLNKAFRDYTRSIQNCKEGAVRCECHSLIDGLINAKNIVQNIVWCHYMQWVSLKTPHSDWLPVSQWRHLILHLTCFACLTFPFTLSSKYYLTMTFVLLWPQQVGLVI